MNIKYLKTASSILFLTPRNTAIWMCMIALGCWITYVSNINWFAAPFIVYGILFLHELFAFTIFKGGLFSSAERVKRNYQWWNLFMDGYGTADIKNMGDLTEGYFNNDFSKTIEQATKDKYEEIVKRLGLKEGDWVLDVGCGLGTFLNYLREKKIHGVGLTLSTDQLEIARKSGLDIRICDIRKPLPEDLVHKFDAITFIGVIEHFGEAYSMADRERYKKVLQKVFANCYLAISPDSKVKKIFSSTNHSNTHARKWTLMDYVHGYLFHGHYSGLYPKDDELKTASAPYFDTQDVYDATTDYYMTSVIGTQHFGSFKINWSIERVISWILLFIVDPFALTRIIYYFKRAWMWQFGTDLERKNDVQIAKTIWQIFTLNQEARLQTPMPK